MTSAIAMNAPIDRDREPALKMPAPVPKLPVFKPPVPKPNVMPIDPTFILRRSPANAVVSYTALCCAPRCLSTKGDITNVSLTHTPTGVHCSRMTPFFSL
jgi:hypothetical protein